MAEIVESEKPQYLDLNELRERYKNGIPLEASVRHAPDFHTITQADNDIDHLISELNMMRKRSNAASWLALREWDASEEFVPAFPQEWAEQIKEDPRYSIKLGY